MLDKQEIRECPECKAVMDFECMAVMDFGRNGILRHYNCPECEYWVIINFDECLAKWGAVHSYKI